MKVMVIFSSPNKDGLTESCAKAAREGAEEAGAEVLMVRLNDLNISNCHVCGNGWGTCYKEGRCQEEDDFQALHQSVSEMDAYVVVTPVYWGEMSEGAKAFFDRLRRCEACKGEKTNLEGKPVISVAAAGGSGNGTLSCLTSMERLFSHLRADKFDFIAITRKSRAHKLDTIKASAREMVAYLNQ